MAQVEAHKLLELYMVIVGAGSREINAQELIVTLKS